MLLQKKKSVQQPCAESACGVNAARVYLQSEGGSIRGVGCCVFVLFGEKQLLQRLRGDGERSVPTA